MTTWTETMLDDLRTLWMHLEPNGRKLSTAEIGRRLGMTKNSIVGKAHRLNLEGRPSPVAFDPNRPPKVKPIRAFEGADTLPPLASVVPLVVAAPEVTKPLEKRLLTRKPMIVDGAIPKMLPTPRPPKPRALPALLARPFGRVICCLWPIGEPGTSSFHFCDDPSAAGRVYCESHCSIAYIRVKSIQELRSQPRRMATPYRSAISGVVHDFSFADY